MYFVNITRYSVSFWFVSNLLQDNYILTFNFLQQLIFTWSRKILITLLHGNSKEGSKFEIDVISRDKLKHAKLNALPHVAKIQSSISVLSIKVNTINIGKRIKEIHRYYSDKLIFASFTWI